MGVNGVEESSFAAAAAEHDRDGVGTEVTEVTEGSDGDTVDNEVTEEALEGSDGTHGDAGSAPEQAVLFLAAAAPSH